MKRPRLLSVGRLARPPNNAVAALGEVRIVVLAMSHEYHPDEAHSISILRFSYSNAVRPGIAYHLYSRYVSLFQLRANDAP